MEIWKAVNVPDYPLKINKKEVTMENINTRSCTQGKLIVPGTKPIMQKTCITDAMRIWNIAPKEITSTTSLLGAKNETKKFVKTLPI